MKRVMLVLLSIIIMLILSSCINVSDAANEKVKQAHAVELALAINAYNIIHPESLIDESDLNYETLYPILDEESLWPEESKDYDWQPVIYLIYFKDGEANIKEAKSAF